METFNARQLYKNEFITRRKDLDFTDDGTRFSFYSYKGIVPFHYTKWRDMVFFSIRPDYIPELDSNLSAIHYEVYRDWKSYEFFDEYNGVKFEEFDLEKLFSNLEAIYIEMSNYLNH